MLKCDISEDIFSKRNIHKKFHRKTFMENFKELAESNRNLEFGVSFLVKIPYKLCLQALQKNSILLWSFGDKASAL